MLAAIGAFIARFDDPANALSRGAEPRAGAALFRLRASRAPRRNGSGGGRTNAAATPAADRAPAHARSTPSASVWVAASAGTGKTKVLTDRVLTLLLAGTAAVAHPLPHLHPRRGGRDGQPRQRAPRQLDRRCDDGALAQELVNLTGRHARREEAISQRAQLFARVLDAPGGVKIADDPRLLPIAAAALPARGRGARRISTVMDERSAAEALTEARDRDAIATARDGTQTASWPRRSAVVARYLAEERFGELMAALAHERAQARRGLAEARTRCCARLARGARRAGRRDGRRAYRAAFCAGACDAAALARRLRALLAERVEDRPRSAARCIAAWLRTDAGRAATNRRLSRRLPHQGRRYPRQPGHQGRRDEGRDDLARILDSEARTRCKRFAERRSAAVILRGHLALVRLGDARCSRLSSATSGARAARLRRSRAQGARICCAGRASRPGCCSSSMAGSITS